MSRRPVGPDKSEQNRATLKQLVKLEGNKSCADCKRNKHPRWASWNIGVFVCIRCSGIHRSMGVHISRVKSVDLDSWTDEQMASMIKWGNARANKYWEHKLAEGHVPNEAKIENFIRTKYDSRRWVLDGPMPDPSTLDDGVGDDDVPLNVVKANIERNGSLRSGGAAAAPSRARQPQVDLFGDVQQSAPARPSTTEPAPGRGFQGPPKAAPAPPKQSRPGESLLGLDFFGGSQSAPQRPASATSGTATPGVPGRTDLKNSILSLYASAPKAAPAPQPQQTQQQPQSNVDLFGGMASPPIVSPTQSSVSRPSNAGLSDSFSSLSFSQPQSKPAAFSDFSSPPSHGRQKNSLSGGSFFDAKPAPPPKQSAPAPSARKLSNGFGDFGDFSSGPSPVASKPMPSAPITSDLFSSPIQPSQTTSTQPPAPQSKLAFPTAAAFNLSNPKPAPPQAQPSFPSASASSDPWGAADNAWATPDPPAPAPAPRPTPAAAPQAAYKPTAAPAPISAPSLSSFDAGWGDDSPASAPAPMSPPPKQTTSGGGFSVQQDEEFGGWSHASPVASAPPPTSARKGSGGGGGGQDDLFGNVWG
ncbi:hypothetical protein B0A48_10468 [Cryoendolithus antarcticus]|uniref:Arf-GAP domain-containing protein n=1 Tax=Cryoendolithus antarcticus TaxID=1507870 RepID=A0A1V8SXF1_9PEZI|nr:hypothetical protein B0A48_10468 [Cryoendolithus antarcticus]